MISAQNFFVLRSPALPIETLIDIDAKIEKVFSIPYFQDALYLASPDLYEAYTRWMNGEIKDYVQIRRIQISLAKYLIRISYRCTPFGLFSGISLGYFENKTELFFNPNNSYKSKTRLDMDYLSALGSHVLKQHELRSNLLYYPNTTIYNIGNKIRYIQYRSNERMRTHHLVSIEKFDALGIVIDTASNGKSIFDLSSILVDSDVNIEEATEFIHELIEEQILVSNLEINITGNDYLLEIIASLGKLKSISPALDSLYQTLNRVNKYLEEIDENSPECSVEKYDKIYNLLRSNIDIPIFRQHLLQADLFKPLSKNCLNSSILKEVEKVLNLFARTNTDYNNYNLYKFKKAFIDRYETQEIPLLALLDSEIGLQYPDNNSQSHDETELIEGIIFPTRTDTNVQMQWESWQQFLFNKYNESVKNGEYSIVLTDNDLSVFLSEKAIPLPASFSVNGYVLANSKEALDAGEFKFVYNVMNGPSAANMFSRFCHLDPALEREASHLLELESEQYEGAIMAEIVHINTARLGNIVRRPQLRKFEIPILLRALSNNEQTILLEDLVVSVINDRVVLRSTKLNREIIPRLSTAHDYKSNALPVYHFLCDLQTQQNATSLSLVYPSILSNIDFFPRIEYGKVILSRAKWLLKADAIKLICNTHKTKDFTLLRSFRIQKNIPYWVTVGDGDNEIPINLDSEFYVEILVGLLGKKTELTIRESLYSLEGSFLKGENGSFTHEVIIPFSSQENRSIHNFTRESKNTLAKRSFILGSEWIYFKIYCGLKASDQLLTMAIRQFMEEALSNDRIDKWFFIRYADPEYHIRLRVHGSGEFYTYVITHLHKILEPYFEEGTVSKLTTDTYVRELERYSAINIEYTEALFCYDSIFVVNALEILINNPSLNNRRWLFALRAVNQLLEIFSLSKANKRALMSELQYSFHREFNIVSNDSKRGLARKYRKHRADILDSLSERSNLFEGKIEEVLTERMYRLTPIANTIRQTLIAVDEAQHSIALTSLLQSYVHMLLNRLFRSKQRMQEMVIYDFLFQYYNSVIAQEK
jgi:thiopeptide-type bacteriocin biosynthesis protein